MPPACTRFTFAPLITSWTLAACPLSCTAPLCFFGGHGEGLHVYKSLPIASVSAIVTDR